MKVLQLLFGERLFGLLLVPISLAVCQVLFFPRDEEYHYYQREIRPTLFENGIFIESDSGRVYRIQVDESEGKPEIQLILVK